MRFRCKQKYAKVASKFVASPTSSGRFHARWLFENLAIAQRTLKIT